MVIIMEPSHAFDLEAVLEAALGTQSMFDTLANIDVVSSFGTGTVIFNRRYDHEGLLSADLQAVGVARTLGLRSVDYARRQYLPENAARNADRARDAYIRAYEISMAHLNACMNSLRTNPRAPLSLGMYAGSVAMERLVHTMFSAHLLYQLRLRIEADAVARIVLEQIAWSVAIARLDSHEEIGRQQPQRSISSLKRIVSNPHVGILYNILSSAAHAGIERHHSVFEVDEEGNGIVKHGLTDWLGSAKIVMMLADLWVIAYESVQRDHLSRVVSTLDEPPYVANPKRAFLDRMRETLAEIEALEVEAKVSKRDD